jgi:hypothetical protein
MHPQPSSADHGPHEMPVPSRNPSTNTDPANSPRPFSYTDSEARFTTQAKPEVKSENDHI